MTSDSPAQDLCLSCGLCCDGSLYSWVRVYETDRSAALGAIGIKVYVGEQGEAFDQPCAALAERACRVYPDRPASCRAFSCKLLLALEGRSITPEDAKARVRQTAALKEILSDELRRAGLQSHRSLRAILRQVWALASVPEGRKRYSPALLGALTLTRHLNRHFCDELVGGHESGMGAAAKAADSQR